MLPISVILLGLLELLQAITVVSRTAQELLSAIVILFAVLSVTGLPTITRSHE